MHQYLGAILSLSLSLLVILSQQDIASDIRCIKVLQSLNSPLSPTPSPPSDIQLTLGTYHYKWNRKRGGEERETEAEGDGIGSVMMTGKNHLPQVNVKYLPYNVTAGNTLYSKD